MIECQLDVPECQREICERAKVMCVGKREGGQRWSVVVKSRLFERALVKSEVAIKVESDYKYHRLTSIVAATCDNT